MTEEQQQASSMPEPKVSCECISKPSEVMKTHETTLGLEDFPIHLTLVTMKRTFLLVIHDSDSRPAIPTSKTQTNEQDDHIIRELMIQGFMDSNTALKGLALGIGDHGTCIINSDNSLSSATLASRLSKKLNANRPVYVANNLQQPQQLLDSDIVMAKLYLRIFQFVQSHYNSDVRGEVNLDGPKSEEVSA